MSISKFIIKNIAKLSLFIPLLMDYQDGITLIIIILLLIYLLRTNNIFKHLYNFLFKNSKKNNKQKEKHVNINKSEQPINEPTENNMDENNEGNNEANNENNNDNNGIFKNFISTLTNNKEINENLTQNPSETFQSENTSAKIDINKKTLSKKKNLDNLEFTPYGNDRKNIKKKYSDKPENYDFSVNVNQAVCSTPIFTLRNYKDIDFYFNFLLHNYDTKKIHNLIMCKDIHKWMSSSSLTDEDITNELVPVYFCLKKKEKVDVYEYLKIFIHNGEDGKIAFIQKGNDYIIIEKYIQELVDKEIINDLLDGKLYNNYNLYSNEGVNDFLNKFLSLVLISENNIGEQVTLDIENYYENKSTYDYFFNTINADSSCFNTTI